MARSKEDDVIVYGNQVFLKGTVTKVFMDTKKVLKCGLKVGVPNTKANAYLTITMFKKDFDKKELDEIDEETEITLNGCLYTSSYDGKNAKVYTTEVIVNEII